MSRRSVTNDRYRVEQKGHTRKSASAAKPKRAAGEVSSASAGKTSAKSTPRRSFWSRGPARAPLPAVENTPEMKRLRGWWFACIGVALVTALAVWVVKPGGKAIDPQISTVLLGLYAVALAGAFYIEFGPLRRARTAAIAAAKKGGKGGKGAQPASKASPAKASSSVDSAPKAQAVTSAGAAGWLAGLFKRRKTGDGEGDGA